MPTLSLSFAFSLASALASASSAPADDLLAAAKAKDVPKLAAALDAHADVNARDPQGRTALMLAAATESFGACRELLWAGADANAQDKSGRTALQQIAKETPENLPLRFLLRCYAYLQANGKRDAPKPANPSLVMILENTVNYLHPKLKAAYEVDNAELLGKPGVDDDGDGFVDDVYGWVLATDKPYAVRETQVDAWKTHHVAIARILQIDEDRATGKISPAEAAFRLMEYTNPLSDLMGPLDGLSDKHFLDLLMEAAHGSHVAGIVLDASEGKARLHTLSVNFAEEDRRMLGPDTDAIVEKIHSDSFIPEVVLQYLHDRLLAWRTQQGHMISRYLRAKGAGVVNMSWGGYAKGWKQIAKAHIKVALQNRANTLPFKVVDPDVDALAEHWSFELFGASAVDIALAAYENPDVLFVVSAGNEGADNDEVLPTPAYLAHFFPNVMTVGWSNDAGWPSSHTNYGPHSVDVAAPGQGIVSTLFPDANVRMSGTSMAAPYVSGTAALMRTLAPGISAADLRRLIDYTASPSLQWAGATRSGGNVDKQALRGCFTGDARTQSNAQARICCNLMGFADEDFPRRVPDAKRAADNSMALDKNNPEAWRAKAVLLTDTDPRQALEAIDRSVQLDPNCEPAWWQRAVIGAKLGSNPLLVESLGKCIDVLAPRKGPAVFLRAQRLVNRAIVHLQLQEVEPARADVRLARQIFPQVELPPELAALL